MNGVVRNYPPWRWMWDRAYAAVTPADWPARLAWAVRPWTVGVERHTIVTRALGSAHSLRVVFASDFHAGPATPWPLIERSVEVVRDLRPDLLLFGGDFISHHPSDAPKLARLLGSLEAPLGRYAVLGNHDYWSDAAAVITALERVGISMLTNRGVALPAPFGEVSVCGLDDYTSGVTDVATAFAGAGPVRLVLMHAPSSLLDLGDRRFDVAFCGHTHGGQIAGPGGRALLAASGPLSRRHNAGRYDLDGRGTLLVSRGIGCGTLPIRINAPSAVLLCTIE